MKTSIEKKICDAALKLIAKDGWHALTLERIAKTANISLAQIKKYFPDKNKIVPIIVRRIDDRTAAGLGKIDSRDTPRDRLFEVMMRRFDTLQETRSANLAILEACRNDPALAALAIPAQINSMRKMLSLARFDVKAGRTSLAAFGLLAVHFRTLYSWQKDKTPDMAKTMAALDQGLRCAERAAEIIFRGS